MKTADIVVGEEYGWEAWKGSTVKRVKVIETGLPYKSPYGYSRKTTNTGVKIEVIGKASNEDDGKAVRTVTSREIVGPWGPIGEAKAAARRYHAEAKVNAREGRAERAKVALELDDLLRAAGVEGEEEFNIWTVNERVTYADTDAVIQEAANSGLFVAIDEQVYGSRAKIIAVRESLALFWLYGTQPSLPVSDLFALANLGDDDPDRTTDLSGEPL